MFEAAYERAVQNLLGRIADAAGDADDPAPEPDGMARIDRIFAAYLQHLVDDPASARLFLVEVYAVGSAALTRRAQLQELFVGLIADVLGAGTDDQRFACQTLAAAISAMVTGRIAADDPEGLLALRVPLLNLVRRGGKLYGDALLPATDAVRGR